MSDIKEELEKVISHNMEWQRICQRQQSIMKAAAAEIEDNWEKLCDEEGFGPQSLLNNLKNERIKDCYPCYCLSYKAQKDHIENLEAEIAELKDIVGLVEAFVDCEDQSCGTIFDELSVRVFEYFK